MPMLELEQLEQLGSLEQDTAERIEADYERGLWVPAISGIGYRCVRKLTDGVVEEGKLFRNTFRQDEAFNRCCAECQSLNAIDAANAAAVVMARKSRVVAASPIPAPVSAYSLRLTKDQMCDVLRGDLGQYHPEPTREEWLDWCESVSESYSAGRFS